MPISFPPSPTLGQIEPYNGKNWQWNGGYWSATTAGGLQVNELLSASISLNGQVDVSAEPSIDAIQVAAATTPLIYL